MFDVFVRSTVSRVACALRARPTLLVIAAALCMAAGGGCCRGWCQEDINTSLNLVDIDGSGPSDVWIAASNGTVFHHDGSGWNQLTPPTSSLSALWVEGPQDVWAAGENVGFLHYDGSSWQHYGTFALSDVAASGKGEAWGSQLGSPGALCRIAGLVPACNHPTLLGTLTALWAAPDGRVAVATNQGLLFLREQEVWSAQELGTSTSVVGVDGDAAGVLWALLSEGSVARVGPPPLHEIQWSYLGVPGTRIFASSPQDVWALGGNQVRHLEANEWVRVDVHSDNQLRAFWATGPDDAWVVGNKGTVLHYRSQR